MVDMIARFELDGGELIVAFDERGVEKFLVLAIIDARDEIQNEVILPYAAAEELFSICLDFLTEG